jgi:hypothetical protein
VAGFMFRLETTQGAPADPSRLEAAVPNWKVGDVIYLGYTELRVVGTRNDDAGQPPVLIVRRRLRLPRGGYPASHADR